MKKPRTIEASGEREFSRAYRAGLSTDMCVACREFGKRQAMAHGPDKAFAPLMWTAKTMPTTR